MEKIKAHLSKDMDGCVTIWEKEPKFHTKGYFTIKEKDIPQHIITIADYYPQLENLVKEGQCVEITITKGDIVYDYNESPEGKIMNAIFGGKVSLTHSIQPPKNNVTSCFQRCTKQAMSGMQKINN